MFANFGAIPLVPADVKSTITYEIGNIFKPSTSKMRDILRTGLEPYIDDIQVDRGYFSGRYAIIIEPKTTKPLNEWQNLITQTLQKAGYSSSYVTSDISKTKSSQAGGVKQVAVETAKATGEVIGIGATTAAKNMMPVIAIGAGLLLAGIYIYGRSKQPQQE